jgi:hypothetical protein
MVYITRQNQSSSFDIPLKNFVNLGKKLKKFGKREMENKSGVWGYGVKKMVQDKISARNLR